jgi:hypothetical protein
MSNLATGNAKHALSARGNDLYQTPPEAVRALLKVEDVPQRIWEPACGPGSIVRVLRESGRDVLATDLVNYESPEQDASGVDFLIPGIAESHADGTRAIVTNPPFKNAEPFIARALKLSPYVAMLLRLGFLESEKRRGILEHSNLARVYVFRNRLPMMHREGWEGPKGGSAICYAWFIWDRSHTGQTQLHRISWEAA